MLAWRDMKNPLKGGAEIVTDNYLAGLAREGHSVTLFSSRFQGSRKSENYHGYTIARSGTPLSVYIEAYKFYKRGNYDLVIDQVNTVPFFTPLYVPRKKRVAFFHQLALDVWFYEKNIAVATIGIVCEWCYLKLYACTRAFVVSNSTKNDLVSYAWMNPKEILVLENQIDFTPMSNVSDKEHAFVFCGRLKKSKRAQDAIRAMVDVDAKLYVIGDGDYKKDLMRLVRKLHLEQKVVFTGQIGLMERDKIMAKSLAILVTSVREGWGLIVTEANANGTIAITYDVPGLRDANKTGIMCRNIKEMRTAMDKMIENPQYHATESITFARTHADWNKNIGRLEKWISH